MGLSFRKSIKIGKNTKINLSSKGGIGISTGLKGARMSINKQGAKIYGGKGPIRYQKQISGIPNLKAKPISTSNGYNDINVSKTMKTKNNSFLAIFKNYYKYILVILIGFFIGGNIGSIGRVPKSLSDEVKLQLKSNATIIQERQAKLDNLNKQLEEISGELGN